MNSAADNKLIEKAVEWAKHRPTTIDIHQTMLRVAVDAIRALEDKQPLKLDQLDNLKDEIQHCIEEDRSSSTTKFARVFSLLMKKLQGSVLIGTPMLDKDSADVPAHGDMDHPERAMPNDASSTGAINAANIKQEAADAVAPELAPTEPKRQPLAPLVNNAAVPAREIKKEVLQPQIIDVSDDELDIKPVIPRVMTIPPAIPRKPQNTAPADHLSPDNNNNTDKAPNPPAKSNSHQPQSTSSKCENTKPTPKTIGNDKINANCKSTQQPPSDPLISHGLTLVALATIPEQQQLNVVQQLQQLQQSTVQQVQASAHQQTQQKLQQVQPIPKQQEPAQVSKVPVEQVHQQPAEVVQAPAQQSAKRKRVNDSAESPRKSSAQGPPEPRPKRASAQRACKMMEDLGAEDAQERQPRSSRRSTAAKRMSSVASEPIKEEKAVPLVEKKKCTVVYCDFSTIDAEKLYHHLKEVHKSRAVIRGFEKGTKCPYCPLPLDDLSHYITHMEKDHEGLGKATILACANCSAKAAQVHTMLLHWNWKNCEKTLKFDYNLAKVALAKKRAVEEKEVKKPLTKLMPRALLAEVGRIKLNFEPTTTMIMRIVPLVLLLCGVVSSESVHVNSPSDKKECPWTPGTLYAGTDVMWYCFPLIVDSSLLNSSTSTSQQSKSARITPTRFACPLACQNGENEFEMKEMKEARSELLLPPPK